MSDHKRLLDAIENATRVSRMLDDVGGTNKLARQIEEATRASRIFEQMGGASRLATQIEQMASPAFLAQQSALHKQFEQMEVARRAMQPTFEAIRIFDEASKMSVAAQAIALRLPEISPPILNQFKAIEDAQRAAAPIDALFRPSVLAAQQMAERIAQITEPHRRFTNDVAAWSKSLEFRLDRIDVAWAQTERLAISGLSFGKLAQFSDIIRYDAPFSEETTEIVAENLGAVVGELDDAPDDREAQYDVAGRNPSLVAFPEAAYDSVVIASGFVLQFPAAPSPQPIENGTGVLAIDDIHHAALRDIENHLRAFISANLKTAEPKWEKQRGPGQLVT